MNKKEQKLEAALKDVRENHNWSWAEEIDYRFKDDMDFPNIYYRGNQIAYRDFKNESDAFAKSLVEMGYQKGDEVLVCMSNCPELVMLMRATSLIGGKFHVIGKDFDPDYIHKIIASAKATNIFVSDDAYATLKPVLDKESNLNKVMFSLCDSLPKGVDPYAILDNPFYEFKNKVNDYKKEEENILNKEEFLDIGCDCKKEIKAKTSIDDEFLITYTSGSTNGNRPSAIVHTTGSLIYMGRFHDPDISGLPVIKHIRVLCHIPSHSNTDLITSISDAFMQKSAAALEPIYNEDFFLNSLIINEVNFAPATRSFWLKACKLYNSNPVYKQFKFKDLFLPTIVGEPKSPGEEKYINQTLRKMDAGVNKIPKPLGPVVVSFGGGDCEHGGIFFTLYPSLMAKLNKLKLRKEPLGLKPFNKAIEIGCLDEFDNQLNVGEVGFLVANSPLTMQRYKNDPAKTRQFFVRDNTGKEWGRMNVYGYVDKFGYAHMLGRNNVVTLDSGKTIPFYKINEAILKDTKNILSCEVVYTDGAYVAHIEAYPDQKISKQKLIESVSQRLAQEFPEDLFKNLLFRIRTTEEGFPLTGCGKRSSILLSEEGLIDDLIQAEVTTDGVTLSKPFAGLSRTLDKNNI